MKNTPAESVHALFPSQATERLDGLMDDLAITDLEFRRLTLALCQYIPMPPTFPDILVTMGLVRDHHLSGCPIDRDEVVSLVTHWEGIVLSRPNHPAHNRYSLPGTHYPSYYGLRRLAQVWKGARPEVRDFVLSFYLELTIPDESDSDNPLSASSFYEGTIAVRDVLDNALANLTAETLDGDSGAEIAIYISKIISEHISAIDNNTSELDENAVRKVQMVHDLIIKARYAGRPLASRSSSRRIVQRTTIPQPDGTLPAQNKPRWQLVASTDESDGDESDVVIVRDPGPRGTIATLSSDLLHYSQQVAALEKSSTRTVGDMSGLRLNTIGAFLDYLFKKGDLLATAFAWLVFVMGADPRELEQLEVEWRERQTNWEGLHLDRRTGYLTFELVGGAVHLVDRQMAHPYVDPFVTLTLSRGFLQAGNIETGKPFHGLVKQLTRYAHQFKHDLRIGCLPPLPDLIRASYWLHVAPRMRDAILSIYPTRSVPGLFGAAGHYYTVKTDDLIPTWNSAQSDILTRWKNHKLVSEDLVDLIGWTGASESPGGLVGSQVSRSAEALNAVPLALSRAFKITRAAPAPTEAMALATSYAERINMQAANLLVMHLFLRGVRPSLHRSMVEFAPDGSCCWTRDKDSARMIERRITHLPPVLLEQHNAYQDSTKQFQAWCTHHQIGFSLRPDRKTLNMPLFLRPRTRAGVVTEYEAVTLNVPPLLSILSKYGIQFPWLDNVGRHSMLSDQRKYVAHCLLSFVGGHPRAGYDPMAPYSSASIDYTKELPSLSESWCRQFNFEVLRVEIS